MARRYRVLTDRMVGHKKGDEIEGQFHPALVGVHLEDITEPAAYKCPQCQIEPDATKKAKAAKFDLGELADHYAADHPGVAAPGEEELANGQART